MSLSITCPVCSVALPVEAKDPPVLDENGLTVTLDGSFVKEHIAMHLACICEWPDGVHEGDPTCTVHGLTI